MMTESRKKILLFVICFTVCIGLGVFRYVIDQFPKEHTVGTITKIWKPAKGEVVASYEYVISGTVYTNSMKLGEYKRRVKVGEKFVVEFPVGYESWGSIKFGQRITH